jgi:hypothetical protein
MPLPAAIFSKEFPKIMANSKMDIPSNSITYMREGKLTKIVFTSVWSEGM